VHTSIAFGQVGFWQLVLVLVVVLLLFGATRLPKLARSLGESMTEFKKGLRGGAGEESGQEKLPPKEEEKKQPDRVNWDQT